MKTKLLALLTAALGLLGGTGTFLQSKDLIDASDAAQINATGAATIPLLAAFGAAIGFAIVTHLLGKYVPGLRQFLPGGKSDDGSSGSGGTLMLLLGAAVALVGTLPSCSALDGPVRIGIITPHSEIGYSSKSGLSVNARVDRLSAK